MKTIRLVIKGKVQGVYFRATAKEMANQVGVTGWTKNLPDKNVEIMATASEELLRHFIEWCKQGPPGAKVDEVIVEELSFQSFSGFRIIR